MEMNRGLPGWLLLFTVVIIGGFAGTALSAENASVTAPAEEAGSVHHEVTGDFSYTAPARLRFDGTRYGGVWDYIPLPRIKRITWWENDAHVLSVALELPLGDRVESRFAVDRRTQVERFLNCLIEWAPDATFQRT